ncbi:MFS transporter [Corynebacterium sp. ES2775-CONJ]|uniref:MFS transporter n=1 Tax=Corynebacterium sp. ES2775-CONJ TaxID=2974029 RepID=UPI0021686254|nr:MFS transporter [Corynebacterium sp. ES2775-CONJ]MCS4489048.1 MFS transporter [Corynebacterium sp. ES2775-CONJ]
MSVDSNKTSLCSITGFVPILIAVAGAFGNLSLLLPLIPLAVIQSGGSLSLAGATTGVFMAATVGAQILTPAALRRWGFTTVIIFSALMLGIPSLGYIFSVETTFLLVISAVRGIGFGALTVAQAAVLAALVPARSLGKAMGLMGFWIGFAQLIMLPAGVYLADLLSFRCVYILAAAVALAAAAMGLLIPSVAVPRPHLKATRSDNIRLLQKVFEPAVAMSATAMGFGALSALLPAAMDRSGASLTLSTFMLAGLGGAQMLSRYGAGLYADSRGRAGYLILPALGLAASGLGLVAVTILGHWDPIFFLVAAIIFGCGYGAVQNESMVKMFQSTPPSRLSTVSALWNISFDGGTGLGSFILGYTASIFAYHGAFIASVIIILGAGAVSLYQVRRKKVRIC